MAGARHRSTLTLMLTALALLAMTARGLLPAGYMVSPDHGGLAAITLCTANGEITVLRDPLTGQVARPGDAHKTPAQDQHGDGHCVFAAMAWVASPAIAPILAAFEPPRPAVQPTLAVRPGQGLAAPPPWSTGPPLTA